MQTTAYVPRECLGLQQRATTSGTSQVEILHIWEPQTSVELPLNSSGQNSCAVGESTSRKIGHMVGFPLTSRALLAKVLESMLVEHSNILADRAYSVRGGDSSCKIQATSLLMVWPAWFDPIIFTSIAFNHHTRANNSERGSEQDLRGLLQVAAGLTITDRSWRCCQFFFLQQ